MSIRKVCILSLVALFYPAVCAFPAAKPARSITYTGDLAYLSGIPVADGNYRLCFRLYNSGSAVGPVWTSPLTTVQTRWGIYTAKLDAVPAAAFSQDSTWIEALAETPTLTPRVQVTAVSSPIPSTYWGLAGNTGTVAGTNFLGTIDRVALEIKVYNMRVMRFEPSGSSPSIIGGFSGNSIASGIIGATIAGGGTYTRPNMIQGHYASIGGGSANIAYGV